MRHKPPLSRKTAGFQFPSARLRLEIPLTCAPRGAPRKNCPRHRATPLCDPVRHNAPSPLRAPTSHAALFSFCRGQICGEPKRKRAGHASCAGMKHDHRARRWRKWRCSLWLRLQKRAAADAVSFAGVAARKAADCRLNSISRRLLKVTTTGKNSGRPVRGNFPQTPGGLRPRPCRGQNFSGDCLRLFYARHHPTVCCSPVRHRAELGSEIKSRASVAPFPHSPLSRLLLSLNFLTRFHARLAVSRSREASSKRQGDGQRF